MAVEKPVVIEVAEPEKEPQRIIEVPLMRMRGFGLKPCVPASPNNAFQQAALAIVDKQPGWPERTQDILDAYYKTWRPESAAEILGLPSSHELAKFPALAAIFPWFRMTPGAYLEAMEIGIKGYFLQNNMADWGLADGHTQWGPVSKRKLESEVNRFDRIVKFVGGMNDKLERCPPILGVLLENDETGEWVFDIRDGLHRAAIFSAFGMERVRVQTVPDISPTVKRSESASWPRVQDGLFTEGEALAIFDAYVGGTL